MGEFADYFLFRLTLKFGTNYICAYGLFLAA